VPNAFPSEVGKALRLSVMKKEKRRRRRPAKRQPEGWHFVLKKSDEPESSGVEGLSLERR